MKTTLSVIKADIGSIGGHLRPSEDLMETVKQHLESNKGSLVVDYRISNTGDDIAILFSHREGVGSSAIHELAWDTFVAGTAKAKETGLYGAGQDLLKDSFSGNIKGLGPAVAELEFEERENEPFLFFAADKTDPGAYNLPLYLGFADPMHCSGLMLSPKMSKGFKFVIMDVEHTEKDRYIELNAPEELYDIAALLRDNERFVVSKIISRETGEQAVAASTTRLHNIAGKYIGKDDPVMLIRVQGSFPAAGEILSPFNIGHYVAGFMRGSHTGPLMPVKMGSGISFFDGPPIVTAAAYCVQKGKFTEPVDCFDHPYWDYVREKVARKSTELRQQGFSGAAMLPYSELEYGGIVEKMKQLENKFKS
ncbi:MAG: fructose 1,6-bisphosphatase [Firmicutes bacterium]|nr:fructose 1,6-bisphosphatase [Bacillota bacterium]